MTIYSHSDDYIFSLKNKENSILSLIFVKSNVSFKGKHRFSCLLLHPIYDVLF